MSEDGPIRLEGRVVARGARTAILRYPLSTALPIPLAVTAPTGIRLVTWAFARLDTADARCLLVLALDEGASLDAGLRLATHFRDIAIAPGASDEDFAPDEHALIARALLAAVSPDESGTLADLIALIGEEVASLTPGADAPLFTPGSEGRSELSGSGVPGHLLLRDEAGWSCHRIARADLHFGPANPPGVQVLLTLKQIWGNPTRGCPTHAIGLTRDGVTPYRIAG